MARIKTCGNIKSITGTVDKTARIVTRVKKFRDPETGEIIGYGPNEYYVLNRINVTLTPNQKQYCKKFGIISTQAKEISNNKNHPRYDELYALFKEQLNSKKPIFHFLNFIRSTLIKELV